MKDYYLLKNVLIVKKEKIKCHIFKINKHLKNKNAQNVNAVWGVYPS